MTCMLCRYGTKSGSLYISQILWNSDTIKMYPMYQRKEEQIGNCVNGTAIESLNCLILNLLNFLEVQFRNWPKRNNYMLKLNYRMIFKLFSFVTWLANLLPRWCKVSIAGLIEPFVMITCTYVIWHAWYEIIFISCIIHIWR